MSHLNVEIKAKCTNQEEIRTLLKREKAEFKGTDHQIDTYFKVNNGRLKLREGNIENYLIYYERANESGPKTAGVTLLETKPNSPLKQMLSNALGVLVEVNKKREIYFIGNVKIHLDEVVGLGAFVEIEARDVDGKIAGEKLLQQCQKYVKLFKIQEEDLLKESYSDLLLSRNKY